jgi:hypothetical protein
MTTASPRLWRLRKLHQAIDATLSEQSPSGTGVEVQFVLNGEIMYARRWPSRADAIADADARRAALEREGWMAHW